jgi:hypothetical protein
MGPSSTRESAGVLTSSWVEISCGKNGFEKLGLGMDGYLEFLRARPAASRPETAMGTQRVWRYELA